MPEFGEIMDAKARLLFVTKLRSHGFTSREMIEASPEVVAELLRQAHEEALAVPPTRSPGQPQRECPD
jgi:hypothetical protein